MRKFVILLAAAAIATGIYALVALREREEPAPQKTFTFNNGTEPETLDPALMTGVPEHRIAIALFEGLVTYHPETLAPAPGVAESWDISEDGLTYTFHLRESTWSNGVPITADDFLYSWRRALEPETAAEYAYQLWYIKNARAYTEGKLADFSQVGVRVTDPHTLEVTLEQPTPYFLGLVAFETFMPVPAECIEQHGNRWTRPGNIVSNGPFVLTEWKPQAKIVMRKNPRYWDAAAVRLDAIVALPIANEDTALSLYKTGGLDWLDSLPAPLIPQLKKHPDYHKAPYLGIYFYRFNCTRKPFDDPRVRRAFNLALDKAKLCRFVLHGEYEPATVFVPPMLPPYESPEGLAYDPDRAAELLAEAGYPGGRGFPRITLVYNTSKRHEDIAVVAQEMWKEALGVDINLVNQEWKVYLQTTNRLDYDIARASWIGDYTDPNTFLDMFVTGGGNNRTGWSNERYDELIRAAAETLDPARRNDLLKEAEDILVNQELPIMPVFFYANLSLLRPRVKGFHQNARNLHPFKNLDVVRP